MSTRGPLPDIHNTLGFLYITIIITSALWGAGTLQAWFYYRKYNNRDTLYTRLLILFVIIVDTVQQGLISEGVYQYAITMHADPLALTKKVDTVIYEVYFAGLVGFAVQQFYCYRIYMLSKNVFISGVVSACSFASLGLVWTYASKVLQYSALQDLIKQQDLCTAMNVVTAVTDILITLAMIWCLGTGRGRGSKKTTDMLNRMIIFSFNTGLLTTILAIVVVITLNLMPNTFYYMGIFVMRDRLYTNSILVTLNSREYIRGGSGGSGQNTSEAITLGGLSSGHGHSTGVIQNQSSMNMDTAHGDLAIKVTKCTLQSNDLPNSWEDVSGKGASV